MRQKSSLLACLLVIVAVLGSSPACRKSGTGSSPPPGTTASAPTPAEAPKPTIDPRVQPVITEMISKWDQVQALSAKVATELPRAAGMEGRTKGDGIYDFAKRDGKLLILFHIANTLWFHTGPGETTRTGEILKFVHDGQALHFQLQQPRKMKKTTRSRYSADKVLQVGGPELFRGLAQKNLTLAPDETVDGVSTYVIEATPVGGTSKARHYFDKQTGIRIRLVEFDDQGTQTFLLSLSELNLQPEFSEGHFTYQLPEGYELIDETGKP